ncbi:hypothetical protein BH11MYX3_BH11MYX3_29060 [soil metagenome]
MRTLLALALVLAAGTASADPKPEATATQSSGCKRVVVGRGLDRKVVCEVTAPVIVNQSAPKPAVLIVNKGGRDVVGRPKSGDRLQGLSHRRNGS